MKDNKQNNKHKPTKEKHNMNFILENKRITFNSSNQKTIIAQTTLPKPITMYGTQRTGAWTSKPVSKEFPIGTRCKYIFQETRSGNYHTLQVIENYITYEFSVNEQEIKKQSEPDYTTLGADGMAMLRDGE